MSRFLHPGIDSYGGNVTWDFEDKFTTDDSAPLASPRTAEPGPGDLTAVQTDGQFSISSAALNIPAQTSPVLNDLALSVDDAITRAAGRAVVFEVTPTTTASGEYGKLGLFTTLYSANDANHLFHLNFNASKVSGSTTALNLATYAVSTSYQLAIIFRATGCFLAIKGGAFSSWTLLWVEPAGTTASHYIGLNNYTFTGTSTSWKSSAAATYTPVPIVSDSFDRADSSTLGNTDGEAVEESGGDGFAWSELSGNPEILSNKITNDSGIGEATVDSEESDVVVQATWRGNGSGVTQALLLRQSDADNGWWIAVDDHASYGQHRILEETGGSTVSRAASPTGVFTSGVDYSIQAAAYGSTIQSAADGDDQVVYSLATANQSVTKHGLQVRGGNSWNNFAIWAREMVGVPF